MTILRYRARYLPLASIIAVWLAQVAFAILTTTFPSITLGFSQDLQALWV
jgi:hypothetical protein